MTLESGSRLGPYEVEASIGGGGMGEIYRAKDTRIDRTVAIKVVATDIAGDSGFKERFEREARAVSSLNHPHICTIHEFDTHDGVDFLVMEHLEGETLAKRLERGPLSQDEALRYGIQIADALDKAHRQGVIHRDLKPGNIMLTPSGAKLLDFGLAKYDPAQKNVDLSGLSAVPTREQPLTREGAILGTFQYMPPEQLEGRDADARTDIFAFGTILYEMLTGKKAFEGKSQAGLIGAILEREPTPLSSERPATPPQLERVIAKCLAKNPDERWGTAHDLMDELRWIREGDVASGSSAVRDRPLTWLVWVSALVLGAVLASLAWWNAMLAPNPGLVTRFAILVPPDQQFDTSMGAINVAVSPDGSHVAYATLDGLYLRAMDQLTAELVPGSGSNPKIPAFSPDGEWIVFWSEDTLKKAPVRQGVAAVTLAPADWPQGMSWGTDDVIRFSNAQGGVYEILANGGALERRIISAEHELFVGPPHLLPDGETLLFTLRDDAIWKVVTESLVDGTRRAIIDGGPFVFYAPSGHVVFWSPPGDLLAAPFDLDRLEVTGAAVSVAQGVDFNNFAVSANGTLAYLPAVTAAGAGKLVWANRDGSIVPALAEEQVFSRPKLSPDGRHVAVEISSLTSAKDIWIYDLERETRTRLTTAAQQDQDALWTPDGATIVFASNRGGRSNLYQKSADGSGDAERFPASESNTEAHSFSPDGKFLAYYQRAVGSDRNRDIWIMSLDDELEPRPFVQTPFNERSPSFSPDGRFIAYASDESGRDEIYVLPFPGPGPRTVVSRGGGREPVWSRDGTELFYRRGNEIWAAPVALGGTFNAETPQKLFEGRFVAERPASGSQTYDVSPDGQRFLLVQPTDQSSQIHVVLNWFQELEERVPTDR